MKIFLACLMMLASQTTFAKKYNCNIQKIPMGKTINHDETNKYIKQFDFVTPLKQKINVEFQNVIISLHPFENEDLYVTFKNIEKDYEISSNFISSQDTITMNTGEMVRLLSVIQAKSSMKQV